MLRYVDVFDGNISLGSPGGLLHTLSALVRDLPHGLPKVLASISKLTHFRCWAVDAFLPARRYTAYVRKRHGTERKFLYVSQAHLAVHSLKSDCNPFFQVEQRGALDRIWRTPSSIPIPPRARLNQLLVRGKDQVTVNRGAHPRRTNGSCTFQFNICGVEKNMCVWRRKRSKARGRGAFV